MDGPQLVEDNNPIDKYFSIHFSSSALHTLFRHMVLKALGFFDFFSQTGHFNLLLLLLNN